MIKLISWIGYDTHSHQLRNITNGIFIAQFFNTGILITLVNANLGETIPVMGKIFNGPFSDYTPMWYVDCGGTLVQTMILTIFIEVIVELTTVITIRMNQKKD